MVYSTYLGGSESDAGQAIGIDGGGNEHVLGVTASIDFPDANAAQAIIGGDSDSFLAIIANPTRTITYTYDGLSRLSGAVEEPGTTYAYSYDKVGNRTSVSVDGALISQPSYNAADQVIGWSYDAAGNLLSDGTTTYSYDVYNHLLTSQSTGHLRGNFYNGDGALVFSVNNSIAISYTLDLVAPLSQILQTKVEGTTTDYLYGLERLASVSGSTRTWYGTDALGSVRLTMDNAGLPLDTFSYDPWGTPQGDAPPTFGFTGELQDATGQVHLRARWYQPTSGRFTSRDPFEGFSQTPNTLHPYSYGANNPVTMLDPSGECYKPLEWLRRLEATNCSNLDAAIRIYNHPNASPRERNLAVSYVSLWTIGHSALLVGAIGFVGGGGVTTVAQWGSAYLASSPSLTAGAQVLGGAAALGGAAYTAYLAFVCDDPLAQTALANPGALGAPFAWQEFGDALLSGWRSLPQVRTVLGRQPGQLYIGGGKFEFPKPIQTKIKAAVQRFPVGDYCDRCANTIGKILKAEGLDVFVQRVENIGKAPMMLGKGSRVVGVNGWHEVVGISTPNGDFFLDGLSIETFGMRPVPWNDYVDLWEYPDGLIATTRRSIP